MGKKISELTASGLLNESDVLALEQSAETVKISIDDFTRYIEGKKRMGNNDSVPFKYACYRNKEKNNELATADQTPITVASAYSGGNITLSNYPYDPSIVNPEEGKEWAIISIDGGYEKYKITGGNLSTGVFQVTVAYAGTSFSVSDEVILINPFINQSFLSTEWMLEVDTGVSWRDDTMVAGAGIFKHSDGHYVWVIHGKGTVNAIGYATADDLEGPWTIGNSDTPIVEGADFGANNTQCSTMGGILWLEEEQRYCVPVAVYNSVDGYNHVGLWKFDEDFSNMDFIDEFYTDGANNNAAASLVRFRNKYYLFYVKTTDTKGNGGYTWMYVTSDSLDGQNWSSPITIWQGISDADQATERAANDGKYYSLDMDMTAPFIYNGTLFLIAGGEPRYTDSGFAYQDYASGSGTNRQFGLWYLDETIDQGSCQFKPDPRGAIILSCQDASSLIWEDYTELFDHVGNCGGVFIDDDGKLYFPYTMKGPTYYGATIVELLIT